MCNVRHFQHIYLFLQYMKYTEQKLTHFADFINNTVLAIKYYLSIA